VALKDDVIRKAAEIVAGAILAEMANASAVQEEGDRSPLPGLPKTLQTRMVRAAATPAPTRKKGGKRLRMSAEQVEQRKAAVLEAVKELKVPAGREAVEKVVGFDPSRYLGLLRTENKLKMEGERRHATYVVAEKKK